MRLLTIFNKDKLYRFNLKNQRKFYIFQKARKKGFVPDLNL